MKYKFKIGDKVKVKDLGLYLNYMKTPEEEDVSFTERMCSKVGKNFIIKRFAEEYDFPVYDFAGFYWHENWLQPAIVEKVKVKDMLN